MRPDVLAEHLATTIRGLLVPMAGRVSSVDTRVLLIDGDLTALTKSVGLQYAGLLETVDAIRARLDAIDAREPVPGPPGPPGPAGRDGIDGKDGAPGLRYCGVYVRGKTYDQGDLVTAGGSAWYCRTTTTTAPATSGDWSLMVKAGRDVGRNARERQATT